MSTANNGGTSSSTAASFRSKAAFMKNWRPNNQPSNRDRLELYALHKQAVSGDAPPSPPANASVSELAKYQAWKHKRGLAPEEAMTQYIAECDRQVRVYGTQRDPNSDPTPTTPQNTPAASHRAATNMPHNTPRGLAAIPLLCAAAAESRLAYLRRLEVTTLQNAWWSRQEPLCGAPGTLAAMPETLLLLLASILERISLHNHIPLPPSVTQSLLWPLHNGLLSVWMGLILLELACGAAAAALGTTLLWGSRRTGVPLETTWETHLVPAARSVRSLCEAHQVLSVRLVGLTLLPMATVERLVSEIIVPRSVVGASVVWLMVMVLWTWWYWWLAVPWLWLCLLVAAANSGMCFAVIEFAGV